jgi:hypothetical protein
MPRYETLPPNNFLGLDEEHSSYEHSAALILPIPYEGTVSYGQGTREGPRAIISASQQVELYDRELDDEAALSYGIHTLPFLAPVVSGPAGMVDAIAACAEEHLRTGKLLVGLTRCDDRSDAPPPRSVPPDERAPSPGSPGGSTSPRRRSHGPESGRQPDSRTRRQSRTSGAERGAGTLRPGG